MQFYKRNNDSLPGGNVLEVYDLIPRKQLAFTKRSNFHTYSVYPTSKVLTRESFCTTEFTKLPPFWLFPPYFLPQPNQPICKQFP